MKNILTALVLSNESRFQDSVVGCVWYFFVFLFKYLIEDQVQVGITSNKWEYLCTLTYVLYEQYTLQICKNMFLEQLLEPEEVVYEVIGV